MEFMVLFLVLLLLVSFYVIYNLYTKYQTLERVAQENVDFIFSMRNRVLSQQSYLKQLDRKGSFEADDEVGVFFNELKKVINDIAVYLEIDDEPSEEETSRNSFNGRIERI
jgi:hypothetical protein